MRNEKRSGEMVESQEEVKEMTNADKAALAAARVLKEEHESPCESCGARICAGCENQHWQLPDDEQEVRP